jgi:hypothetical protein
MEKIFLRCGGKKIPAIINYEKYNFTLKFPYFKPLIEEIRGMNKRQWVADEKLWSFGYSERNTFILKMLTGKNPYANYDKPLKKVYKKDSLLREAQQYMYEQVLLRKRTIIAGQMRIGKTLPMLKVIEKLKKAAWWVAPHSAILGLKLEMRKWDFKGDITLLTYDAFKARYTEYDKNIVSIVVFDESQKLKSSTSQRGVEARYFASNMRKVHKDNAYIVLLTGTPSPNNPSDWWNQCEVVCPGFLKEDSTQAMKRRLGVWEMKPGGSGMYPSLIHWKEDELALMYKRLSGLVEVYLKKDYLDIPEKEYTIKNLKVSKVYSNAASMEAKLEANPLQIWNKLRQISDGFLYHFVYNEDTGKNEREEFYFENCPKDEQLKLDLDNYEDEGRLVIFCAFAASLKKILKICLERDWVVLKLDGKSFDVLGSSLDIEIVLKEMDAATTYRKIPKLVVAAQADSGSTGLELSATSKIIYYSNSLNGASRMQSEDRAHSQAQKRNLEICDYIHLPVDEMVLNNLKNKKNNQAITMGDIVKVMGLMRKE